MVLEEAAKDDYGTIKKLYDSAFPKDERASYFVLKLRARQKKADFLIAREDGGFVGFAYVITCDDLAYLFYLAVTPEHRKEGVGSLILTLLKERYAGKRFFLAREQLTEDSDNYEERVNRHNFYLHNGLSDLPMRIKEANVVYDVMGTGGSVTAEEYNKLITRWGGIIMRTVLGMRVME